MQEIYVAQDVLLAASSKRHFMGEVIAVTERIVGCHLFTVSLPALVTI
jgi:hypothetical protein